MSSNVLELQRRETFTGGELNLLRKHGNIPGVVYGDSSAVENVSIEELMLMKTLTSGNNSKVIDVELDKKNFKTVIKDVQFDPVTDRPLHVDFMRVSKGSKINIRVPIRFLNEMLSPAIKRGGVLNIAIHEALLSCSIDAIPSFLDVDVSGLDFHSSIKVKDLPIPESARFVHLTNGELTVATVVAPSGLRSEFGKAAEAADTAKNESK